MSLSTVLVALSLVSAGALVATTRTRWGRRRPLHRYACLSVAAHFLLLAALASVRSGGPARQGVEAGPPLRVEIVMQAPAAEEVEPEPAPEPIAPDSIEPDPAPPGVEEVAVATSEPPPQPPVEQSPKPPSPEPPSAEPLAREPFAEEPAPAPEVTTPLDVPENAWAGPESTPAPQTPADASPPQLPIGEQPPAPEQYADPAPVAREPAAPVSPYARRGELQRRRIAADQGGDAETLDAIAAACDWFARAQRPDGAWDPEAWSAGRETRTLGHDRRGAGRRAEAGLTALALLALGGAGHTHLDGPFQQTVAYGLQFLIDEQAANGDLAGDASLYARTYCHSMATFALAEALAVTGDPRLRRSVVKAVDYLVRGQSRATGGWRYEPGARGDMSQMGWAVMALRSAELAGVAVPEPTWRGCERFVESVARGRRGGLACYQPEAPTTRTMTAEAMYCRQILGLAGLRPAAEDEAVAYLMETPPGAAGRRVDLYYWYYGTLALHHHRSTGADAESAWNSWRNALRRRLIGAQVGRGSNQGSWEPNSRWAGYGGRVYATAMAAMCLEVDFRYDSDAIGRDPWLVAREGAGPLYR